MPSMQRVGVYVDAENIRYNGGYQMRYDVLRRFAARENGILQRLNTYIAYDSERARDDFEYAKKSKTYQQMVRDFGWKVTMKIVRRYTDEIGNISTKANADLDMAVDAMLQSEKLDLVILVTGDGDFLQVVNALQNRGCRVELIAFKNISRQLQQEVDEFWSGYLIPDLLPVSYEPRNDGVRQAPAFVAFVRNGSQIRLWFLRFIDKLSPDLWITDPREPDSPYVSVFCHANELAEEVTEEVLLNRETILEFYLSESEQKDNGLVANNVRLAFGVNR